MNNIEKKMSDILNNVRFYDLKQTKGINSAKLKDASYILPKTKPKILNPSLAAIGKVEDSYEEISDND